MTNPKIKGQNQPNIEFIMSDKDNNLLIRALENFTSTLSRYGFTVSAYSNSALARLNEISIEKKAIIRTFFENWNNWISPCNEGTDIIEIDLELEKKFLKRALDHYGLWIHDDFWKTLEKGQVIELYG